MTNEEYEAARRDASIDLLTDLWTREDAAAGFPPEDPVVLRARAARAWDEVETWQ